MKKLLIGTLIALIALSVFSAGALAGSSQPRRIVGPYEGTFQGYVYGDKNSKAPLTLVLTHREGIVRGTATLGEGMYISAGRCGGGRLPAVSQPIVGESIARNPNRIEADTQFSVGSFKIGVEFESELSGDGKTMSADARIDIPWICGRDPVLTGTLYRVK